MMEQWLQIRQRVLREGVSKRQILKETGMHWTTLERILSNPNPPGYCRSKPTYSKIAVSKIIGPRQRELTVGFQQLVSHYLFRYHFCLVRRANGPSYRLSSTFAI